MRYTKRLEIRLSEPDTARVEYLAERAGRSASELVRCLIRSIDPERVPTGLPLLPLGAETAERELSVA